LAAFSLLQSISAGFLIRERIVEVCVRLASRLVAGANGGRGRVRGLFVSGLSGCVPRPVQRPQIVGDDFRRAPLSAILGNPIADLQPAIHGNQAAFVQIVGRELRGMPPGDDVDEVCLLLACLIPGHRPVDGDAERSHGHAARGIP